MRRVLSFVLSMCLVFSLLPAVTIMTAQEVSAQAPVHSTHDHNDGTWTAWTKTDSLPTSGKYYLTQPVTMGARVALQGSLTLCLCGKTVTAPSSAQMFRVYEGASLTICDCSATYDANGDLKGGTLFGNATNGSIVMFSPSSTPSVNVPVTLERVILDGNNSVLNHGSGYGGCAMWSGNPKVDISLTDCVVRNFGTKHNGGAIDLTYGGNLTANNVLFQNNKATAYGGAIAAFGGNTVSLTGCTFTGNQSETGGGGAVAMDKGGSLTVSNCLFDQNKHTSAPSGTFGGGAILVKSGNPTVSITGSTFTKNTSAYQAGAVYLLSGSTTAATTISDCDFTENQSYHGGGAIFHHSVGSLKISDNTTFTSNKSTNNRGGAIWTSRPLEINDATFTTNSSYSDGGAIYVNGASGDLTVEDVTFTGNTNTNKGGAIYLAAGTAHSIKNGIFENNVCTDDGGAVYHGGGTLSVDNCSFTGNNARVGGAGEGGALYSVSTATIHNSTITGNNSAKSGALWSSGALTLTGSTKVYGNTDAATTTADVYLSDSNKLTLNALDGAYINVATASDKAATDFLLAGSNLASGILPVYYQNTGKQLYNTAGTLSLVEEAHREHYVCTCAMGTTGCTHTEGITSWTPWDGNVSLPTAEGNYYLTENVTLSQDITINAKVKLCLNGHDIDLNQHNIKNQDNLTIMNCRASLNSKKQLSSENGKLYNGKGADMGGAIRSAGSAGSLQLIGVLFTGNTGLGSDVRSGGALYLENGTTTIQSCKFEDNSALSDSSVANRGAGGAISMYYNANATITDTVFIGNKAQLCGSAINACNKEAKKDTSLIINGNTEFTGNTTINVNGAGSALYLLDLNENYDLQVTIGGNTVIADNTAGSTAAVILRSDYAASPLRTVFTENVRIYGNSASNSKHANVYIADDNTKLTLDALGTDHNVNISTANDKQVNDFLLAGSSLNAGNLNVYYQNGDGAVYYDGSVFTLVSMEHKDHYACACVIGAEGCSHGTAPEEEWKPWPSDSSLPTATGNYYLTTDVNLSQVAGSGAVYQVRSGATVKLCLNGHSIDCDQNNNLESAYFAYGGNLTIMNCRAKLDSNNKLDRANSIGGRISGAKGKRASALRAYGTAYLELIGVELSNNSAVASNGNLGGALLADGGTVNVRYCRFTDNYSDQLGGAIVLNCHSSNVPVVTVENTVFTGNESRNHGGAIGVFTDSATTTNCVLTVTDSVFENNVSGIGGAVGLWREENTPAATKITATFDGCSFTGNTARTGGGAIFSYGRADGKTELILKDSKLSGNVSDHEGTDRSYGGAVRLIDTDMTASNTDFRKNLSRDGGGAIYGQDSRVMLEGCWINENRTKLIGGGGIYMNTGAAYVGTRNSVLKIHDSVITDNSVDEVTDGGGIRAYRGVDIELKGGLISGNTAATGAGISLMNGSSLTMLSGEISNHSAPKSGGAVYASDSVVTIKDGTITKNTAAENGGAIMIVSNNGVGTLDLQGGTIKENSAQSPGGAIFMHTNTLLLQTGGTVTGNYSPLNGGAVYLAAGAEARLDGGSYTNNISDDSGGAINSSGATVKLSGVTVQNNKAKGYGGGVNMYFNSKLIMDDGLVDQNESGLCGGGIALFCDAEISGGKITNNKIVPHEDYENRVKKGGGIYIYDTDSVYTQRFFDLDISGGEISGNYSPQNGGGIAMNGRHKVTMTGGTIKNNVAGELGGGIMLDNKEHFRASITLLRVIGGEISGNTAVDGGGIYARLCSRVDMQGGTVSNNTATGTGGGIYLARGVQSQLRNVTLSGNTAAKGAALYFMDDTVLENMTVTGNNAGSGYAVYLEKGDYDGESYVLGIIKMGGKMYVANNNGTKPDMFIGKDANINILDSGLASGTQVNIALEEGVLTNTIFGTYGYTGGNLQYTVTAGNKSLTQLETYSAPSNAHTSHVACVCAMGATGCTHGTLSSVSWSSTGTMPTSTGSYYLTKDITLTSNVTISGTVKLCLNGHNINLNGHNITNTGNLTIMNCRAKLTNNDQMVTETGKIYGGSKSGNGGAISSSGTALTLLGLNLTGNKTTSTSGSGGAVYVSSGTLTLHSCDLLSNTTKGNGGAVCTESGVNAQIIGCKFSGNKSTKGGGALYLTGCTATVKGCLFAQNAASTDGGAFYLSGNASNPAKLTMTDTEFMWNNATEDGAGFYTASGVEKVTMTGCRFETNYSSGVGGGIGHFSGVMDLTDCFFHRNWAGKANVGKGGAIYAGRELNVTDSTFDNNEAAAYGAVIYTSYTMTMDGCTVYDSGGDKSTGIKKTSVVFYMPNTTDTKVTVKDSQFYNNYTSGNGTVFYINGTDPYAASFEASNTTFRNNVSDGAGGAIYAPQSVKLFKLTECTFQNNKAVNEGGAIAHYSGTLSMEKCDFTSNSTTGSTNGHGGAVYASRALEATECTFTTNTSKLSGGAIYAGYTTSLTDCAVNNNLASLHGAVAYVPNSENTKLTISGGEIAANTASGNGGAIYMAGNGTISATLEASNAMFVKNTAIGAGGAIYAPQAIGTISLTGCTVDRNSSDMEGGAIAMYSGVLKTTGSTFTENSSDDNGGAIYAKRELQATNCTFDANTAGGSGAAIHAGYTTALTDTTICNSTKGSNGAVCFEPNSAGVCMLIQGGRISGNTVGGVYFNNEATKGEISISGSTVIKNNTANGVAQNLYLTDTAVVELGNLASGASIGVTSAKALESGNSIKIATTLPSYYKAGMLYSDVEDMVVDPDTDGASELYLKKLDPVAAVETQTYTDIESAMTAAGSTKVVKLLRDLNGDLVLSADTILDLDGNDVRGDVTGSGNLYLLDSQTNDYNVEDGNGYGRITGSIARSVTIKDYTRIEGRRYIVVTDENGTHAHRIYAAITARALRPNDEGIGYVAKFGADQVIQALLTNGNRARNGYGLKLTANNGAQVVRNVRLLAPNRAFRSGEDLVFVISNFFVDGADNDARAKYTITGQPFVMINGKEYTAEADKQSVTFQQMFNYADDHFNDGSVKEAARAAIYKLYEQNQSFITTANGWKLNNIPGYTPAA